VKLSDPNAPDNVIALKPRAVSASLLIRSKPGTRSCFQHSFLIDPKDPVVECANCKRTFTAMDALEDIARTWTNRAYELKNMGDELVRGAEQLAELKREIANLRAQKRRLEGK
jgi:hypothetical protein